MLATVLAETLSLLCINQRTFDKGTPAAYILLKDFNVVTFCVRGPATSATAPVDNADLSLATAYRYSDYILCETLQPSPISSIGMGHVLTSVLGGNEIKLLYQQENDGHVHF